MIDQDSGNSSSGDFSSEPDFAARSDRPLVGSVLRRARDYHQLSLRDVERRIGISDAYLSQIELGIIKRPDPSVILELSKLYGLSFRTLTEGVREVDDDSDEAGSQARNSTSALTEGVREFNDDPDEAGSQARNSTSALVRRITELNASERAHFLSYVDSILRGRRT